MIFGFKQIKKLKENNIITDENYNNLFKYLNNLVNYSDNYPYTEDYFSEEDRKLIKEEYKKGNFDIFSDKDLINAKSDAIINEDELTNILSALSKKGSDLGNDALCFKTTPISKVIVLSILSGGIYNIILSYNYWKTLKENCDYKISPFWRGLFEIFTNFKLFPIFSKYFNGFEIKFEHPIFLAILYLIGCIRINILGIRTPDLLFCIMISSIFAYIQYKINKINEINHLNACKNSWNVANIIWVIILSYPAFIYLCNELKTLFR